MAEFDKLEAFETLVEPVRRAYKLDAFETLVGQPVRRAFGVFANLGLAEESAYLHGELVASAFRCDVPGFYIDQQIDFFRNVQVNPWHWKTGLSGSLYAKIRSNYRFPFDPSLSSGTLALVDPWIQGATENDVGAFWQFLDAFERDDRFNCCGITRGYAVDLAQAGKWSLAAKFAAVSGAFEEFHSPAAVGVLQSARDALPYRPVGHIGETDDLALAAAGAALLGDKNSARGFSLLHAAASQERADFHRFMEPLYTSNHRDLALFSGDFADRGYFALSAQLATTGLALVDDTPSELDGLIGKALDKTGRRREFEALVERYSTSAPAARVPKPSDPTSLPVPPSRSVNAWIDTPDPVVRKPFRISANIGWRKDGTAVSAPFAEPEWGERATLPLLLTLSGASCSIEPSECLLDLPRTGESDKVCFTVEAEEPGQLDLKLKVYLTNTYILIQSFALTVDINAEKVLEPS